jgi:hypothetical protein
VTKEQYYKDDGNDDDTENNPMKMTIGNCWHEKISRAKFIDSPMKGTN